MVRDIDTFFYETSCGSGTVAVCICSCENEVRVLQPSGCEIIGKKMVKADKIYVKITGAVITDNKIRKLYEEELL